MENRAGEGVRGGILSDISFCFSFAVSRNRGENHSKKIPYTFLRKNPINPKNPPKKSQKSQKSKRNPKNNPKNPKKSRKNPDPVRHFEK